ncbi:uncharacterized protein EI97DRAFT_208082 [Westerdykella ornata]|uniref:Uncharacterized protein n=1 Tax=Westerdykella ornata TaxID=318751 RepID=A0A6A6J7G6_WESOR|nr:uncharacterized protein EI97DRAFT_208082 [Westerdykella ornata]KAF2272521.1 hypothetical protein EI97DRAFT_208082 [Westerdykella ornata]
MLQSQRRLTVVDSFAVREVVHSCHRSTDRTTGSPSTADIRIGMMHGKRTGGVSCPGATLTLAYHVNNWSRTAGGLKCAAWHPMQGASRDASTRESRLNRLSGFNHVGLIGRECGEAGQPCGANNGQLCCFCSSSSSNTSASRPAITCTRRGSDVPISCQLLRTTTRALKRSCATMYSVLSADRLAQPGWS